MKSIAKCPEARGLRCGVHRPDSAGFTHWCEAVAVVLNHWADRLLACWLG